MAKTRSLDLSPLAADMRTQDPDRYLATLFAPAARREALFALYAFDHEIAKVRRLVREPMAGLIRLQWWRDALDGIEAGEVPDHPVAAGLHHAITRHGLDRRLLVGAIQARERELEEPPPTTLADFEQHVSAANGAIARAAVSMLGGEDQGVLAVADHVGMGLGFLERLRGLDASRGDLPLWLPQTLVAKQDFREQLAARGLGHFARARAEKASVTRGVLSAFFPGTLAEIRLRDLKRSEGHPAIATAPFRLCWHWLRGRF